MSGLTMFQEFPDGEADVLGDLAEQGRGDVAALVHRHGGAPAVGVPVLHMGAALPHDNKPQPLQYAADLARLQDENRAHGQATLMVWVPTNSASSFGSPSSSSMATTSCKLACNSSGFAA